MKDEIFQTSNVPQQIAEKYALFNPADASEGSAERLQTMLTNMTKYRENIETALSYSPGTHTFDQLVMMVLSGHLTLWALGDSYLLTEVQTFPSARHFHVFLGGGDLEVLANMHTDMLLLAKALQCDKVTLAGRTGWERAFRAYGWTRYLVTLSKDVEP